VRLTKEAGGSEELGRWVRTEGIEGVNGVSAELKAVLGGSEEDRGSGSRWLNDGQHNGTVAVKGWRSKKVAPLGGRGAHFIAGGGDWQRRRKLRPDSGSDDTVGGRAVMATV
jgi:hypothetical protein